MLILCARRDVADHSQAVRLSFLSHMILPIYFNFFRNLQKGKSQKRMSFRNWEPSLKQYLR